jgi:ABC-type transporter Mla maintaining outer membrane lipid asymmetry ATPase subunit MlaF
MEPIAMKESIETILQIIGLVNDRQTFSKNLSGGMKRRLSIGISLMGDPKVFSILLFSFIIIIHYFRFSSLMNQQVALVIT